MVDQLEERNRLLGSFVLFVAALAGGTLAFREPYKPQRPEPRVERASRPILGAAPVEARLWEDPLGAVVQALDSRGSGESQGYAGTTQAESIDSLAKEILHTLERLDRLPSYGLSTEPDVSIADGEQVIPGVTILPVWVAGGMNTLDRETRRRERYAVVSALGQLNYRPRSSSRLAYVQTAWVYHQPNSTGSEERVQFRGDSGDFRRLPGMNHSPTPFEWFDLSGSHSAGEGQAPTADSVLVLWIDVDFFGSHPLEGFDQMLTGILSGAPVLERCLRDTGDLDICLVGPNDSSGLVTVVRELLEKKARREQAQQEASRAPAGTAGGSGGGRTFTSDYPSDQEIEELLLGLVRKWRDLMLALEIEVDAAATDAVLVDELKGRLDRAEIQSELTLPTVRHFAGRLLRADEGFLEELTGGVVGEASRQVTAETYLLVDRWQRETFGTLAGDSLMPGRREVAEVLRKGLGRAVTYGGGDLGEQAPYPGRTLRDQMAVDLFAAGVMGTISIEQRMQLQEEAKEFSAQTLQGLGQDKGADPVLMYFGNLALNFEVVLGEVQSGLERIRAGDDRSRTPVAQAIYFQLLSGLAAEERDLGLSMPDDPDSLEEPDWRQLVGAAMTTIAEEVERKVPESRARAESRGAEDTNTADLVSYLEPTTEPSAERLSVGQWVRSVTPQLQHKLHFLDVHQVQADGTSVRLDPAEFGTSIAWDLLLRARTRPRIPLRRIWRPAAADLWRFLTEDDNDGVRATDGISFLVGNAILQDRHLDPPLTPDTQEGEWRDLRWLARTADRRRTVIRELPAIQASKPDGIEDFQFDAQVRYELARWEWQLAKEVGPNSPMAAAFALQFQLEQKLIQGLDIDGRKDRKGVLHCRKCLLEDLAVILRNSAFGQGVIYPAQGRAQLGGVQIAQAVCDLLDRAGQDYQEKQVRAAVDGWVDDALLYYGKAQRNSAGGKSKELNGVEGGSSGPFRGAYAERWGWLSPLVLESSRQGRMQSVLPFVRMMSNRATLSYEGLQGRVEGGLPEMSDSQPGEKGRAATVRVLNELYTEACKVPDSMQPAYVSTVLDDVAVLGGIVTELEARGCAFESGKDVAVIISEWDTAFGRDLPRAFAGALGERSVEGSDEVVYVYHYLRGLDGREGAVARSGETQSTQDGVTSEDLERPFGPSQFDTMRRLTAQLEGLSKTLSREGKRICAVGVLGSDVYDKLLVLQALHDKIPGAQFFSTDLDARLFHPSRLPWCRNLIIGSTYGLRLADSLQDKIPPFRDSYQTSTFFAVQLGLAGLHHPLPQTGGLGFGKGGGEFVLDRLDPRIFEVSRIGGYDLSPKYARGSLAETSKDRSAGIYPPLRKDRPRGMTVALAVFMLLSLGALLAALNDRWQSYLASVLGRLLRFFGAKTSMGKDSREYLEEEGISPVGSLDKIILLTASLAVAALVAIYWDSPAREPFEVLAGISAWPALLGRLVVIGLGLGVFFWAAYLLRRSQRRIATQFRLDPSSTVILKKRKEALSKAGVRGRPIVLHGMALLSLEDPSPGRLEWLRAFVRSLGISTWRQPTKKPKQVRAKSLWREYLIRSRFEARALRILPHLVAFWILFLFLRYIFPIPAEPVRGGTARAVSLVTFWLSGLVTLAVILFVVDATRLFDRFVALLSESESKWKDEALQVECDRAGVRGDAARWSLDIRLIAERSQAIGELILYPFALLTILVVTRNAYFDAWTWPVTIVLPLVILYLLALVTALVLRRSAERARKYGLQRLSELRKDYGCHDAAPDPGAAQGSDASPLVNLENLIQEMRDIRYGAFSSYLQSPILRAILLPFGGMGMLISGTEFIRTLGL